MVLHMVVKPSELYVLLITSPSKFLTMAHLSELVLTVKLSTFTASIPFNALPVVNVTVLEVLQELLLVLLTKKLILLQMVKQILHQLELVQMQVQIQV